MGFQNNDWLIKRETYNNPSGPNHSFENYCNNCGRRLIEDEADLCLGCEQRLTNYEQN